MNSRNEICAVLFDLDNTLYDRDQTFEQCAHGFVEEHLAILEQDRRAEVLEQILTNVASTQRN